MPSRRQFGRVRKLPSGRWQARYPDGSGRDAPAPLTFASKGDATRFLAQVQADLDRGRWQDPRLGKVTLAEWVDEWLDRNPAKRPSTRARDMTVLRTHFLPGLGNRQLAAITPAHVRDVIDVMATKVAPTTVRTNVGVIRAVLNAAVEADLIGRSPLRAVRLAKGTPRQRPVLTPDELLQLAEAIGPQFRALVLLAGTLGLRWSEAVGLRVTDVDFVDSTITVRQTLAEVRGRLQVAPAKSRSSLRTLSVPRFLLEELADHLAAQRNQPEPHELVFTGRQGAPLRRNFAARIFKPAVAAAGLDPALSFHGLRHVATSLMVEAGEHPRVIQQRLGHATARLSMELYAHVPEASDRAVAKNLDARFAATTGTQRARRSADPSR